MAGAEQSPFPNLGSLQDILNDPAIKEMAEQIASDPQFMQVAQSLQQSGLPGIPGGPPSTGGAPPGMDPGQYAQAMSQMFSNPGFAEMAEKLGQQIMQDPEMSQAMQRMQDPDIHKKMEERLESMKDDPEMAPIIKDLHENGPAAMMRYWQDPEMLAKFSTIMNDVDLNLGAAGGNQEEVEGGEEDNEEGEDEEEDEVNVHSAASTGDLDALKELLDGGADVSEKDEEGRTALHFACGYGELPCAEALIAKGADVDVEDTNKNTPLHYAAGYGRADAIELLLKHRATTSKQNLDGKTPLEVADLNEQKDAAELLRKQAAPATPGNIDVKGKGAA